MKRSDSDAPRLSEVGWRARSKVEFEFETTGGAGTAGSGGEVKRAEIGTSGSRISPETAMRAKASKLIYIRVSS